MSEDGTGGSALYSVYSGTALDVAEGSKDEGNPKGCGAVLCWGAPGGGIEAPSSGAMAGGGSDGATAGEVVMGLAPNGATPPPPKGGTAITWGLGNAKVPMEGGGPPMPKGGAPGGKPAPGMVKDGMATDDTAMDLGGGAIRAASGS